MFCVFHFNFRRSFSLSKLNKHIRQEFRSGRLPDSLTPHAIKVAESWHHQIVSARPGHWHLWCRLTLAAENATQSYDNRFLSDDYIVGAFLDAFASHIGRRVKYFGTFEREDGNPHFHLLLNLKKTPTPVEVHSAANMFKNLSAVWNNPLFRADAYVEKIPLDGTDYQEFSQYLTGSGEVFMGLSPKNEIQPYHEATQSRFSATASSLSIRDGRRDT